MKTDKFMQGILVSDEDDLFTYGHPKQHKVINQVIKNLRKNLDSLKHIRLRSEAISHNKQAVFSKNTVDGNIDEAVADMWFRLGINHHADHTNDD